MRSKSTRVLRFAMFSGLLVLELGLIVAFYILPQIQARNSPATGLGNEMPFRDGLGMRVAVIAYLSLLVVGNLGLVALVWRSYKQLKAAE
jgi:hypothetical protein